MKDNYYDPTETIDSVDSIESVNDEKNIDFNIDLESNLDTEPSDKPANINTASTSDTVEQIYTVSATDNTSSIQETDDDMEESDENMEEVQIYIDEDENEKYTSNDAEIYSAQNTMGDGFFDDLSKHNQGAPEKEQNLNLKDDEINKNNAIDSSFLEIYDNDKLDFVFSDNVNNSISSDTGEKRIDNHNSALKNNIVLPLNNNIISDTLITDHHGLPETLMLDKANEEELINDTISSIDDPINIYYDKETISNNSEVHLDSSLDSSLDASLDTSLDATLNTTFNDSQDSTTDDDLRIDTSFLTDDDLAAEKQAPDNTMELNDVHTSDTSVDLDNIIDDTHDNISDDKLDDNLDDSKYNATDNATNHSTDDDLRIDTSFLNDDDLAAEKQAPDNTMELNDVHTSDTSVDLDNIIDDTHDNISDDKLDDNLDDSKYNATDNATNNSTDDELRIDTSFLTDDDLAAEKQAPDNTMELNDVHTSDTSVDLDNIIDDTHDNISDDKLDDNLDDSKYNATDNTTNNSTDDELRIDTSFLTDDDLTAEKQAPDNQTDELLASSINESDFNNKNASIALSDEELYNITNEAVFNEDYKDEAPNTPDFSEEETRQILPDISLDEEALGMTDELGVEQNISLSIDELDDIIKHKQEENLIETIKEPDSNLLESTIPIAEREKTIDTFSEESGVNKIEIRKMIGYLDKLFDKLPEETVLEFSRSEYFGLYKKIMDELGL